MDTSFTCVRVSVTGEELLSLLEHGATSEQEQQAGGPSRFHPFAVSGLKLTYHLGKDEGNRVSDVTLEDGGKLQMDALYTVSYIQGPFRRGNLTKQKPVVQ